LADSWARRLMTRIYQAFGMQLKHIENKCGWCECMWMLNWTKSDTVEARSPDLFNVAFQLFICHPMTVTWWESLPCCVLASGHQPCQWFETQLQILSSEQSQSHTVGLRLHILTQCLDGFSCQIYQSLSCYLRIVPDSDLQFHRLWNQLPLSCKFQILKCINTRATEFSLVYKRTRLNLRVLLLQGVLVPLKRSWCKSVSPCLILFDLHIYIYVYIYAVYIYIY
jgi:hypothetical protein